MEPKVGAAGLLDLTTVVYPDKPSTAAAVVPQRAFVLAASNLLMVRYMPRNNQGGNINFCPVAAFRFVDMDHPTQHHPAALAGPIHTSPLEWQVHEVDGEPVLTLPHAVPFLNERAACTFAPAVQDTRLVEMLPPKDGTGRWLKPDHMVYSRVQHVAFVFCSLVQVQYSLSLYLRTDSLASCSRLPLITHLHFGSKLQFIRCNKRTDYVAQHWCSIHVCPGPTSYAS